MSLTPPVQARSLRRPVSAWGWVQRLLLWPLFLLSSLMLVAWLSLHWAILPHIEQWRPQIEARAGALLGVPVKIGGIQVRSRGWIPSIALRDVVLFDRQGRAALSLPHVATALSPRSLLALEPRFEQLLVEGAHLEVRRSADGRIFVAGLDLSGPGGSDTEAADWVVKQREIVIRGGSLRWTDERRNAPALELTDVQLVMRNGLRRHDLRLDATPPPGWGDRFHAQGRFTQSLLARSGDWQRWSGQLHADLPRADVRELSRHVSLPFELSQGVGALRAWLDVREGQPLEGTADVALRAVSLRLAANVAPLTVEQLQGRVVGRRTEQGLSLSLQKFGFLSGTGLRWEPGDLSLNLRQRPGEPSSGGEFSAQRLDLGLLAEVAASLPLGDAVRRLLAEVKPQGTLSGLTAQWAGPLDAPTQYQVGGALGGLTLASRPAARADAVGRPGLRNAALQLSANQDGGSAELSVAGGAVDLPGVFEDPLVPLERLHANLAWKIDAASNISVQVKDARFANRDAQGEFSAQWATGAGSGVARGGRWPGQIEVNGKLTQAVAARTARYLPVGIPEPTRRYVEQAVKGGTLSSVGFRVKGDLWDFPFRTATSKGELRIAAQAEDVSFAYVPNAPATATQAARESPWPMLTGVSGELVLDRSTLSIRNVQAQLGGLQWSRLQGDIANLAEQPVLALNGTAQGPLAEMLRVVNATPVGGWIGKALAQSTGAGAAELQLGLSIPLRDVASTDVKGQLLLAGNDVRITPETPLLAGARGRVEFDRSGFALVGASARAYGGDLTFEGGTQHNAAAGEASIRFTGQGSTTADALRRVPELGLLARLAGHLKGQTSYRLDLGFVKGHPELTVTSNLVGMASELPAPLRKAAEAPLALRYQTSPLRDSLAAGQPLRDSLRVDVGNLMQAQYQREWIEGAPKVLRGGVGVGEPAPSPASGVAVAVNLPSLNVDAWQRVYDKLFDDPRAAVGAVGAAADLAGGAAAGAAAGAGDTQDASAPPASSASSGYAPSALTVRAQDMLFLSRRLSKVVARLSQDKAQWRANVEADQLAGYVEYRPPQQRAAARVYARLSRLSLPKSEVDQVETLLEEQPPTAPALDIVVDDFELRGKRLGRLEIEAVNRTYTEGRTEGRIDSRDALREWRLAKFNLLTPEAQLTASGHWALGAPGSTARRAVMDFKLVLKDSGAYVERLGMGRAVRGGKGQISGQLAWQGSPLTIDYASLSGQAHVDVQNGQFLKVDPGAARLLGVLSLQSLPRRLALDFRDLFDEGFSFDSFAGDLKITQGVAATNNLRTRGVQAVVLMEGQADLARETQNLRVVVVPEINAGTASLAYAIINPAVGLGTFLAQMFLRRPFMQAGTREFSITGPWADPKVDRVERAADAAMPDLDPPRSAQPPEQPEPSTSPASSAPPASDQRPAQ